MRQKVVLVGRGQRKAGLCTALQRQPKAANGRASHIGVSDGRVHTTLHGSNVQLEGDREGVRACICMSIH
jgi:hypothetical protein